MYTNEDIISRMPHPTPRYGQIEAIRFAKEKFDSGVKVVIIEAPTGSGKSAIGLTLGSFFGNSFYLTSQKLLQDQIIRDYSKYGMVELRGKTGYDCTFYDIHGQKAIDDKKITKVALDILKEKSKDCEKGYCRRALGRSKCRTCFDIQPEELQARGLIYSTCPYYEQVERALAAPHVLMNFSAFIYQTQYAKRFPARELMVIDEAHNVEQQLLDFITVSFDDKAMKQFDLRLPTYDDASQYAEWFINNEFGYLLAQAYENYKANNETEKALEIERLAIKYKVFIDDISDPNADIEWVCEKEIIDTDKLKVTIKPVYAKSFANKIFFNNANKILMMSATILDPSVMVESLGLKPSDVAFFRIGSSFPKSNRPIYIDYACKMSGGKSKMPEWGPKLVTKVDTILDKYMNVRGIIHTHTFAISELLVNSSKHNKRFLYQKNFETKQDMLDVHYKSSNTIIVAPAMHEGLDLKDDLSRVQILAKVPYPNFFDDKQLARRNEIDRRYIIWLTALKMAQQYGRSIRSETDWAHTFIIDETFSHFFRDACNILPKWFTEAISTC